MSTVILLIAAVVLAPVTVWCALVWGHRPAVAMGVGLFLSVISLAQAMPNSLRFAIAISLIPHAGLALYGYRGSGNDRMRLPSLLPFMAYIGLCGLSTLWSRAPSQTVISTVAWLVLLGFVLTFRSILHPQVIRTVVFIVLALIMVTSFLCLALPFGWAEGRARGIFQNANAAAIFAYLFAGVSIWMGRRYYIWIIPLCTVFVALTGSRAGMLALLAAVLIPLYTSMNWLQRLFSFTLFAVTALPLYSWLKSLLTRGESSLLLLRLNNSREATTAVSLKTFRESPWFGVGYRATPPGVGSSSYLKLLAELGLLGALIAGAVIVAYLLWSRSDTVMLGLAVGAVLNCAFEDWLITAGAPMLFIFLMLVMSTPQRTRAVTYPARLNRV